MICFKQSEQVILDVILSLHYILDDIQNDCSITAYVQTIVCYEKNTDLSTSNQLF
jgi:hypothetical protein